MIIDNLTDKQIGKLSTKRLLDIYRGVRFMYSFYNGYDDIDDWERAAEEHQKYVEKLKTELESREHVPRKA